jgi:hypothetical protein
MVSAGDETGLPINSPMPLRTRMPQVVQEEGEWAL